MQAEYDSVNVGPFFRLKPQQPSEFKSQFGEGFLPKFNFKIVGPRSTVTLGLCIKSTTSGPLLT